MSYLPKVRVIGDQIEGGAHTCALSFIKLLEIKKLFLFNTQP